MKFIHDKDNVAAKANLLIGSINKLSADDANVNHAGVIELSHGLESMGQEPLTPVKNSLPEDSPDIPAQIGITRHSLVTMLEKLVVGSIEHDQQELKDAIENMKHFVRDRSTNPDELDFLSMVSSSAVDSITSYTKKEGVDKLTGNKKLHDLLLSLGEGRHEDAVTGAGIILRRARNSIANIKVITELADPTKRYMGLVYRVAAALNSGDEDMLLGAALNRANFETTAKDILTVLENVLFNITVDDEVRYAFRSNGHYAYRYFKADSEGYPECKIELMKTTPSDEPVIDMGKLSSSLDTTLKSLLTVDGTMLSDTYTNVIDMQRVTNKILGGVKHAVGEDLERIVKTPTELVIGNEYQQAAFMCELVEDIATQTSEVFMNALSNLKDLQILIRKL